MLFSSYEFIFLFLPMSFFVYFYLSYKRLTTASKSWLVFVSLFFYSWWDVTYLPLILTSILFNYSIASAIIEYNTNKKKYFTKKLLLQIGLAFNVGLLVYFKYMDFFIANLNWSFDSNIPIMNIILPLGISFFTITQIAFLIDCYEGLVKERNFLNYMLFVTFFPHLLAGPILHHKEIMPQFASIRNKVINYRNIAIGLFIFSIGLFKKVVIADTFGKWTHAGFDTTCTLNLFEAWATSLSFTCQVYFDFSGYTDMAIGVALLFNIKFPQNFNSPYKATSIIDFWLRWHMTLTNFVSYYIYTPMLLSFKKMTFSKAMFVTFVAFVIVGLWHGASWTFIVFGALHGIAAIINHIWKKTKRKMNYILAWFITFNFINITFVIFRAKKWDDAFRILHGMFSLDNILLPDKLANKLSFLSQYGVIFGNFTNNIATDNQPFLWILVGFILVTLFKNSSEIASYSNLHRTQILNIRNSIYFSILFMFSILYMSISPYSEFIYFNF